MENSDTKGNRTPIFLLLIFLLFIIGIIIVGVLYYKNIEKKFRTEKENELTAIAELKVSQIVQWRKERLGDGNIFYKNEVFTGQVIHYLKNPNDIDAKNHIQTWLNKSKTHYGYDAAFLSDTNNTKRIIISERTEPPKTLISPHKYDSLKLGKIVFEDFYRDETLQKIFLKVLIPIIDEKNNNQFIAVVELRIDPETYLYPLINSWPTPSKTAETLIAKREGDSAVYLNEIKFTENAALNLRIPLNRKDILVVKAMLGEKGVVEGLDYKGDEVIGYVCHVPNSPWFMVARMDKSEVFAPLKEKLWTMIVFVIVLILVTGGGLGFIWRHQSVKIYKEKIESAEEIKNKEESLRFALETNKSGAWDLNLLDGTARRTLIHDQIFGYESLLPKWTYEMFLEHVLPEDRPEVERSFGEAIATVSDWNFECRILRADGEVRWISANGGHKKNQECKPILMSGLVQDITIRKQAEDMIIEGKQRLDDILTGANTATWEWNIMTGETVFNERWADIIGYTLEEISPVSIETWMKFTHPDDLKLSDELLQKHFNGESALYECEARMKHKNGNWVWVIDRGKVYQWDKEGKPLFMSGTHLDITKRKEDEEKLQASKDYLNKIIDAVGSPIFVKNDKHKLTLVNTAFCKLLNLPPEELIGLTGYELFPKEQADIFIAKDDKVLNTGIENMNEELVTDGQGMIRTFVTKKSLYTDSWGNKFLVGVGYDISERKKTEEALLTANQELSDLNNKQKSTQTATLNMLEDLRVEVEARKKGEKLYSTILKTSMEGFCITDIQGQMLEVNEMYCRMSGYSEQELLAFKITDLESIETAKEAEAHIKKIVMLGSDRFESQHTRKDGTLFNVEISALYMQQDGGRIIVFINDITHRKLAEDALQISETRYRDLFNKANEGLILLTMDGQLAEVNQAFADMHGYTIDEIKNMNITDLDVLKEEAFDGRAKVMKRLLAGEVVRFEVEHYHKKGHIVTFSDTVSVITIHGEQFFQAFHQDITQRKKDEQQRKLLESVVTNTNDAIMITDAECYAKSGPKIVYVNEAFTKMTGYSAADITGKTPLVLRGPKTDKAEEKRLSQAYKNFETCEITTINYKKNGEPFWVYYSVSPVANEAGKITNWISIQRDITTEKNDLLQKELLTQISLLFNEPISLLKTLETVLNRLADFGHFSLAEIWLLGTDEKKINLLATSHLTDPSKLFYQASAHLNSFEKGEGLPGSVWESGKITAWRNRQEDERFLRMPAATIAGFKSGCSFPIIYKNKVLGVFVVMVNEDKELANKHALLFQNLGTVIGAEIRRKQLEEELEQLFNYAPDIICIIGIDGYFKKINARASELFEYTEAELLSKHVYHFVHPDDMAHTQHKLAGIDMLQAIPYFENRCVTKSGKLIWLGWTVTPSPEEGLFFAVAKDITDKKKAEEEIRLSNERYNLVALATNDAIWDMDVITGTITRTGDGYKTLFGYTEKTEPDDNLHWSLLIHPQDLLRVKESKSKALKNTKNNLWEDEYRFKRADGTYAFVYDKGYIIRDKKGLAIRMIGATQDITNIMENGMRLQEMNESLQLQAKEMATTNAELEQFAFAASHDLQEPLRTVSSFLTLIENKYSGAIDEAGQKYIAFAVDGAKRMRQIILDLLEFSRVGQMLDEKQSIDLNGLVNEVWQACSQMVQEKNAQIRVDELPVLKAYKTPLMQVFQNLISNAVKYCKKEVQPQINITAREFKTHWQFAIADNGLGIDNKYFVKIFVIFQRLHAKESFTGTGIGLAVTKKIIENMGGKIWVESVEGKGSTFYFTIPK